MANLTIKGELSSPSLSPGKMSNAELAKLVTGAFQKFKTLLPYVVELKKRFASLPRGKGKIHGCDTWRQFCEEKLYRTPRGVRKAIAGEEESERKGKPKDWSKATTFDERETERLAKEEAFEKEKREYPGTPEEFDLLSDLEQTIERHVRHWPVTELTPTFAKALTEFVEEVVCRLQGHEIFYTLIKKPE